MEEEADKIQGAQITSNNFCGMPVVWGVETDRNVTYDAATVKELWVLSQPLPKEVTKNGVYKPGQSY